MIVTDCYAAVENEMQEQFQRAFEGGEGMRAGETLRVRF